MQRFVMKSARQSLESRQSATRLLFRIVIGVGGIILCSQLALTSIRLFLSEVYTYETNLKINTPAAYEAEPALLKAIKYNPHNGYAHYFLGAFYQRQGRLQEAQRELREALRTMAHPATPLRLLAENAYSRQAYDEAVHYFDVSLTMNPKPKQTSSLDWYLFAKACAMAGRIPQAISALKIAQLYGAREADLHLLLGDYYSQLGNTALALHEYITDYLSHPQDRATFPRLIKLGEKTGDYSQPLEFFQRRYAAGRLSSDGVAFLGLLYYLKKNYSQALALLNEAITSNPNEARNYFLRGEVYRELGNTQQMRQDYQTYLRLAPAAPERAYIEKSLK
jgi:tetratricopeptide (TPR) repeat protein